MSRLVLLLVALALSACASTTRTRPVDALALADAPFLAGEAAAYVASELPPASSTVWISLPASPATVNAPAAPIGAATASALRDRGFAVVEGDEAAGHAVSVDAITLAGRTESGPAGVLLKVSIDGAAASRWYDRDAAGALSAGGAFTVRAAR